ncbi:hypothetical protein BATDEDRAFT_35212 [Batrachochytrium dendrobatidis JAM81]|uniref:Nucleoside diphosphate kinase n=1 Tax=Batrachochytrium dendrobatidis (strain JAM81 / FGSC 10211) TaxID=684364 RepID=F4P4A3_BATDJ|nr:uncharacterized protein BATDEDRAFT_35212 [Batrachochytrium dendrobatidis JAM81]EGF79674.1 hypothetical protein BATDEDRAFT_35212 [Batrachochytrium dendrobatidis JAM81]KAJ8323411.1 hypothetical protein O5D80_008156 [Batrachochytrium dendrobatidis]|eukprot:XP_006679540.1 hypothetical protein BATDEDRAFT_35212 [Batrachochytrium dendrobatidis JAM81]
MSAHTKRTELALPACIASDEEWTHHLSKQGLRVFDVYAKWAGSCEPMQNIFKRLKVEHGEDVCFVQAQSDHIEALKNLRGKSCPTFLFFFDGTLVKMVKGANAPLIEKTIKEQLDMEKAGHPHHHIVFDDMGAQILAGPLQDGATCNAAENHDSTAAATDINQEHHPNVKTTLRQHETGSGELSATSNTSDSPGLEETLALIKPDAMSPGVLDQIIDIIRLNRFEIVNRKKVWMTEANVREFYASHVEKSFFPSLVSYLSSAPTLALILKKENAVSAWRELMGPASAIRAKEEAPRSIRAKFGTDSRLNAVFGSDSVETAKHEIDLLFGPNAALTTMSFDEAAISGAPANPQKTLLFIKPDAMSTSTVDGIIERIICCGFQVLKREEVTLTVDMANEIFYYLKERTFFDDYIAHMTSDSVIALVLKGDGVIDGMQQIIGPDDPIEAKERFPMSIRALYGTDVVKNAVYSSVTPEEALHDIHLIFPHVLKRTGSSIFSSRPGTAFASQSASRTQSQAQLHARLERTLALIKPDVYPLHKDAILARMKSEGFTIICESEMRFTIEKAQDFYKEHEGKSFYVELTMWMSSAPIFAVVLEKSNGIGLWRELAGPTNSIKAKEISPNSIRALFGKDGSHNAVHGSDSPASAEREIGIVFGETVSPYPDPLENTLALIKPDVYPAKRDDIMNKIHESGFDVIKESEVHFTIEKAREFYIEHDGRPFYETLVNWMSSSPIYAIVLSGSGAIKKWRTLAGPTNSEKARESDPTSIRALYGKDGSENAVHGSDSPASAYREIQLVFGEEFAKSIELNPQPSHTAGAFHLQKTGSKKDLKESNTAKSIVSSTHNIAEPLSHESAQVELKHNEELADNESKQHDTSIHHEKGQPNEQSENHESHKDHEAAEKVSSQSELQSVSEAEVQKIQEHSKMADQSSNIAQPPLQPHPPTEAPLSTGGSRPNLDSARHASKSNLGHQPSMPSITAENKSSLAKDSPKFGSVKSVSNLGSKSTGSKANVSGRKASITGSHPGSASSNVSVSASKTKLNGSKSKIGKSTSSELNKSTKASLVAKSHNTIEPSPPKSKPGSQANLHTTESSAP